jgi:CDP-paratose 2-epimerase
MRIAVTGICGFAGSRLARRLLQSLDGAVICGLDNLCRPGSEINRLQLPSLGIRVYHGDARMASDFDALPEVDWVIDAAANPSVLAGVDGRTSSRQLVEHNLLGTLNVLEYAKRCRAGFVLLSSSRVYSIPPLASLPVRPVGAAYSLDTTESVPPGVTAEGLTEKFSTEAPVSLYGGTKLASECLALEYSAAFGIPVWVNRCGVLAGAGQFGTAEQGIFSYWVHAHAAHQRLRYIGFGGNGWQVRDAFHPDDLADLVAKQIGRTSPGTRSIYNVGGGSGNSMSLAELTAWCDDRFGPHAPVPDLAPRPFDIPWLVMDAGLVRQEFNWGPTRPLTSILDEIAVHATQNPDWLSRCSAL